MTKKKKTHCCPDYNAELWNLPVSVSVLRSRVSGPLEQAIRGERPASELKVQKQGEKCAPPLHLSSPAVPTQQTPSDKDKYSQTGGKKRETALLLSCADFQEKQSHCPSEWSNSKFGEVHIHCNSPGMTFGANTLLPKIHEKKPPTSPNPLKKRKTF